MENNLEWNTDWKTAPYCYPILTTKFRDYRYYYISTNDLENWDYPTKLFVLYNHKHKLIAQEEAFKDGVDDTIAILKRYADEDYQKYLKRKTVKRGNLTPKEPLFQKDKYYVVYFLPSTHELYKFWRSCRRHTNYRSPWSDGYKEPDGIVRIWEYDTKEQAQIDVCLFANPRKIKEFNLPEGGRFSIY